MESVFEEFLVWLGVNTQAIGEAVPQFTSEILSQSATAFYQLKIIVGIEGPRVLASISIAEWVAAAGLVLIILGIRKRLYYKGVLMYSLGIGALVLGLVNIVNQIALHPLLRF
ncbi:MAG: hypothetical protein R3293_27330 [Candidatus Promineifilaceae bacterium]|nr:hypothetical protein [Candidatus Promineifilaceae bacterium]